MKKSISALFVGLLTIAIVSSFKSDNKIQAAAPPAINVYMTALLESPTYKANLQQSLMYSCKDVLNNYQGQTTVEATYKLKFVKGVLQSTSSPEFKAVLYWVTNVDNHNDFGNSENGFNNCRDRFNDDFDRIVKSFYGIEY